MSKSAFVQQLDAIVGAVAPVLKSAGFRKKGRAFNRSVESGLIDVVSFQMGQFPLGDLDKYVVPGLRENLYGLYTINLGVHIQEVFELGRPGLATPAFVQDYHCEPRTRLAAVADPTHDTWWPLHDQSSTTPVSALLQRALDVWFPAYATRDRILAIDARTAPLGWPRRGGLVQAIMWARRGDKERAALMLKSYFAAYQESVQPWSRGHGTYIQDVAQRLGVAL